MIPDILRHPKIAFRIDVDDIDITDSIRPRLIRLTHTDNRGFESDTVELELDDSDGRLDIPPRRAELRLRFGWSGETLVDKGIFIVDEVSHHGAPDTLSIRARAADLADGLAVQHERSWHDTTVGAIVRTIAHENGLKPVINVGLSGIPVDHLDQTHETSANLLTRLAEWHDAIASVKNGRLLFLPAGAGRSASGKRIPAVTITRRSGDRHQFLLADRATYTAVRARYHDTAAATKGEVTWGKTEDSAERNIRPAAAPAPAAGQYKLLAGTSASRPKAIKAAQKAWKKLQGNKAERAAWVGVKAAYDDRNLKVSGHVTWGKADDERRRHSAVKKAARDNGTPAATPPATDAGFTQSTDSVKTLRHVYANRNNALRAARAEWRRLQRGMATLTLDLAIGIPELIPERPVTVDGFKPQIDNTDWILTRITNTIDADGGYSQRLEHEIKATEIPDI